VLDPYAVVVPYSKWYVVERRLGLTLPFSVALVSNTDDAADVVTDGTAPVVNVRSDPVVVPPAFTATSRKWYVVLAARAVRSADAATPLVPDPALVSDVLDPYAVVVPYSKWYVVEAPLGFTLPFTVAVVATTGSAACVATVGFRSVVNVWSEPVVVPAALVATRRKWYVVPGVSPVRFAEAPTSLAPEPAPVLVVLDPYAVVVPYSK